MATTLRYIGDECWVIPTGPAKTQSPEPNADPNPKPSTGPSAFPTPPASSARPRRRRQHRAHLKLLRLATWLPRPQHRAAEAEPREGTAPKASNEGACEAGSIQAETAGRPTDPMAEPYRPLKSKRKRPSAPAAKASRVLWRKQMHTQAKAARQQDRAAHAEPPLRKPKDWVPVEMPVLASQGGPQGDPLLRSEADDPEPLSALEARINLQLDLAQALQADAKALAAKGDARRPVAVVEVTNKVIGDFFYLRPDDAVADLICGVLGRALEKTGVGLVALHVLSNHVGMLLTVHSCSQLASLMHRFNQQTSHRIGRHLNLPTRLWAGRYHAVVLTGDPGIQLNRLRYCLGNGTKENLVAHPSQWPGVHSARFFCNDEVLAGHWTDFTGYGKALRRDPKARIEDHQTRYVLKHTKLPCFEHLTDAEYKALARAQCDDAAEKMARERRKGKVGPAAGPEALRRVSIHDRPESPARSARPPVHSLDPAAKRRFQAAYKNYVAHHQAVRARLAAGLKVLGIDFTGGISPTGWEPTDPASVVPPPTMAIAEATASS